MPCNSNNFQHIKKILRTSVDNLVSEIPNFNTQRFKFQVDRKTIIRVLLLAEFKNAVLEKRVV